MFKQLDSFLPKMEEANKVLETEIAKGNIEKFKIDADDMEVTDEPSESDEIEMDGGSSSKDTTPSGPTIEFVSTT